MSWEEGSEPRRATEGAAQWEEGSQGCLPQGGVGEHWEVNTHLLDLGMWQPSGPFGVCWGLKPHVKGGWKAMKETASVAGKGDGEELVGRGVEV